MTTYAKRTKVPIQKSRRDIEELLYKYRATRTVLYNEPEAAAVAFEMQDRRVMFKIRLPKSDQQQRQQWRALYLTIKAKLVSVDSGIETFEDAFMAHVVMPDGATIADHIAPKIATAYSTGTMPPLLPAPS